ncbi:MAG: antitoxin family protein [Anaerolineae bacterium]
MDKIITAVYERGVLRPLQDVHLREQQTVKLHVLPPRVLISAADARRKVSRFVLDEISYLMGGEQPALVKTDRLYWRVPVVLTNPTPGTVGTVGFIDVDAETGDLVTTPALIKELICNAHALAACSTSQAAS